jgi:hypothetical protein
MSRQLFGCVAALGLSVALLAPLVRFHKTTSDIIYVYTAVMARNRVYYESTQ